MTTGFAQNQLLSPMFCVEFAENLLEPLKLGTLVLEVLVVYLDRSTPLPFLVNLGVRD